MIQTTPDQADVIRIGECSRVLGTTRNVIRRLANQGKFPHSRSPGQQRLFNRAFVGQVLEVVNGHEMLPMEGER